MKVRLTDTGKRAVACAAAGVVVLALLLFFILFRVSSVDVVGSTKYTDEEIKEYALTSPLTSNTLLTEWLMDHIDAEDIPFVESFDLERLGMHKLRIHVNEKKIVGYVVQGTDKLYFDKDGNVVEMESMNEEEKAALESASQELEDLEAEAEQQEALKKAQEAEEALTGKVTDEEEFNQTEEETKESSEQSQQAAQSLTAEEVVGNEDATEFHAAVTDVPRVIGLYTGTVQLGQKIPAEDDSVFNTILGITRIVEKYEILPEMVYFDETLEITLVYNNGSIHCKLGKDTLLEEKITRVAAILPKLEGMTGILHLEGYTEDTTNIIFSQESLYTLKSIIAAAEGVITDASPAQAEAADTDLTDAADTAPTDAAATDETPADTTGSEGTEGDAAVPASSDGETDGTAEEGSVEGETTEGGTAESGTADEAMPDDGTAANDTAETGSQSETGAGT
ncbi:MAG: hypothetical protein EOM18_01710 [Clostridia bacterium]|nr:hypothetical protein [Clostridia bacterium]